MAREKFPATGAAWEDLNAQLSGAKQGDIDWQRGRSPLFVFLNDQETYEVGKKAFFEFFAENALGATRAFYSVGRMEKTVLDFGLDHLGAPDGGVGVFTNGGTESIFLAVKGAREAHRAKHGRSSGPLNIVMPDTAHAAFDKSADVMDLEIRRAPLGADKRVDVEAMAQLIDDNTMLLVGSAPCYPHGVVDRIDQISDLAQQHSIWLHVDACVGGWILPFFRQNGRDIPAFEFTLPGVRSISADLHKFGFCPKPASTVFFRSGEDLERSMFVADAWPSGIFRTATLAGSRPGGAIAGAWAVLNHLGKSGYAQAARRLADMTDAYVRDISAIDEFEFWAKPDMSIINFGSRTVEIPAVAAAMADRGWLPAQTRRPPGLHLMMSLLHQGAREDFVSDLKSSVSEVKNAGASRTLEATYGR